MPKPTPRLAANPAVEKTGLNSTETLDLTALQQTPGFMIRILQIQILRSFLNIFRRLAFPLRSILRLSRSATIRPLLKARLQAPCESNSRTS